MTVRYECKLDSELLKKAVTELNEPENNDERLEEIDKLRNRFLKEQQEFQLLRSDDAFILRFLRAKKFNQDKAFATLVNYHRKRSEIREVFDKVDDPQQVAHLLDRGGVVPIRQKAKDGSTVIISRIGVNWHEGVTMYDQMAVGIILLEYLLEDESVQINGITQINDYAQAGVHLLKMLSPTIMKRLSGVMTDAMPLRVKVVHMVNEYKIFSIFYAIAKPFIKEKIQKRMRMHGENLTNVHEDVDPKGLPQFLAGTGPDLDVAGWKERLLSTVGHGERTDL